MKKSPYIIGTSAVLMSLLAVSPALAHDGHSNDKDFTKVETKLGVKLDQVTDWFNKQKESGKFQNATIAGAVVHGIVTANSSSTLTVAGKDGKTYSVVTTDASIKSISTTTANTIGVGDIKTNDAIFVAGTLDGTTIKAKTIVVGNWPAAIDGKDGKKGEDGKHGGNGILKKLGGVASGIVSSINGNTITLANKKNGTTTVTTASSTTYRINGEATTSAAVGVGSRVVVSGTSTGTTTASASIIDIFTKGFRYVKHVCFGWMHK